MSTTALTEKPKQDLKKIDLKQLLSADAIREQVARALPTHLKPDRFLRVAMTALTRTPKLMACTRESFMECLLTLSAFGIEPDGRRAHLIPYGDKCTLVVDWKGLAELVMRSGIIAKLHADLVCENDVFEYDLGAIIAHKIDWRKDRGEPYAAYAMAETKDGAKFVQVMTKAEIEKIRDNSQGYKGALKYNKTDSPWMTAPGEMWKKTCFRRLSKWLPLSAEFRDAVERDDEDYEQLPEREVTPQVSTPKFLKQPEPTTDHGGFADHDLMTDEKPEGHEEGEGVVK
jgi:recombination protein RecT